MKVTSVRVIQLRLERGMRMSNFEPHEVDPKQYEVSRRRFLRNAGVVAASVP